MTARWSVRVDPALCTGSGVCAGVAPHLFALDTGNIARAAAAELDAQDTLLSAAECCPMQAITLEDARTGEVVHPDE
jgi:ferredoxin